MAMFYKTILIHIPSSRRAAAMLDVAIPVAQSQDAHLIGLNVVPFVPNYYGDGMYVPPDVINEQRKLLLEDAAKIETIFSERVAAAGLKFEWRTQETAYSSVFPAVMDDARCADLMIASQTGDDFFALLGEVPAELAMGAGRPVLLVPTAGTFASVGKRPLIAWDGTRESARAAFDALPFLKQAEAVHVLTIDPGEQLEDNPLSPGEGLALSLARHDVSVEANTSMTNGEISVAEELLSRASDHGCDLLVMGCYGHSRLRETLFGGTTRAILKSMTVPVLLSH
jgi:nucleotide-binding universal stress UspA family protein